MAMNVGSAEDGDDPQMNSTINTTPLVDVMLVLLIIFLITIPVVTQSIQLTLPKEKNVPTQTKPENILLAVSRDGDIYWGVQPIPDVETLVERLKKESVKDPQPWLRPRPNPGSGFPGPGTAPTPTPPRTPRPAAQPLTIHHPIRSLRSPT